MNSTWSSADAAVLEGQRARGVDAEHGDAGQLDERAQAVVDEAPVARQRRQEAAQHVVERNVVIAGHAEHLVAALAQPFEEPARLAELLGPRALGEVAADRRPGRASARRRCASTAFDQPLVVRAEMQVGQMDEAGHASQLNASASALRSSVVR